MAESLLRDPPWDPLLLEEDPLLEAARESGYSSPSLLAPPEGIWRSYLQFCSVVGFFNLFAIVMSNMKYYSNRLLNIIGT